MTAARAQRPNILFITADQQRADCFSFAGRAVRTPHLDGLAREGTWFSACITPNVVCQPARASILTGLLPLSHGVHDNGIDLDPAMGERGFAGALAAAGYNTAFIGKAHFATYHTFEPTGTPECIRSSARYGDDWFGPYMGFEHVELMLLGHNWWNPPSPPEGQHYERWYYADGHGDAKNALYRDGYPGTHAAQTWDCKLPVAWHNSTWVGDRTVQFIRRHTERPWCLWASFPDPHHPFDAPEPWCYLHDPESVDLPKHRTRDLDRRPWWHREVLERKIGGKFGDVRTSYSRIPPQTDDQLRHIIANTYGMIALIDHNVGRILIALDEAGLRDDTIVVYSSDHGDWLGDHGLILKGPMHYDGLLRVPLLLRGPSIPQDQVIDEVVSTLDLAATFGEWAGTETVAARHSRSIAPVIAGSETREFAYNEWEMHSNRAGVPLSLRCVRTKTHKLTFEQTSGEGELYDLANDPDEMDNRWDDPAVAEAQKELLDMIRSRRTDTIGGLNAPVGAA